MQALCLLRRGVATVLAEVLFLRCGTSPLKPELEPHQMSNQRVLGESSRHIPRMWEVYVKNPEELLVLQIKLVCNQNKCRLINAIIMDVYLGRRMDEN